MTIYHDGTKVPTAPPKDANSDVWRGFTYTLAENETIVSSEWLINETPASNGQTIAGLTMKYRYNQGIYTKINLTGGTLGRTYLITNRVVTTKTALDDRSFYLKIVKL
jgi:hypothetical protein